MGQDLLEYNLSIYINKILLLIGTPEEIAFTVSWLADERNGYTTGANIPVNGGMFMSA